MNDLLPIIVIGLVSGSVYGLAGVGLVLTYRTSGLFNFAHGATAALAAFLFYQFWQVNGLPWPVAFGLAGLVFGPLMGLALELVARSLTSAPTAARVVATLGILLAVQQLIVIKYGAVALFMPPFLPIDVVDIFGVRVGFDQLIVMGLSLAGTIVVSALLRFTRLGLQMRAVVDNTDLLALTGSSPKAVRRWSWCIGSVFGAVSGIVLAPTLGLDAFVLTLLVVAAFGAVALGLFRSLPLTYLGGLVLGVGGSLVTFYSASNPSLSGLVPSLPFMALFGVLLLVPRSKLVDITAERRLPARRAGLLTGRARQVSIAVGVVALLVIPALVGSRLVIFITGLVYVLVFLSLVVIERFSGQLSLSQLAFVALGGSTFAHLAGAGVPWVAAVLLASLLVVPVGALLAIPAIRLSGLYLALATFGFGLLMQNLVYGSRFMFGAGDGSLSAQRPAFAQGDAAYYYVVLLFVLAGVTVVVGVRDSRLGRLLRGMADSQVALVTHGMNPTVLKVLAFCISAFIAGLAGTLMGPVTGTLNSAPFGIFASMILVVVLALQVPLPDVPAAFVSAAALIVVPSYLNSELLNEWLPFVFGIGAIAVAVAQANSSSAASGGRDPESELPERATLLERAHSSPIKARVAEARTRAADGVLI